MMYDELVSHLRECAKLDPSENTFAEAADAIEDLQAQLMFSNDAAKTIAEKVPRWIPATERLPEYMENVLVTDGVFSGMGWRDWYDYRGTKPREDYWISPNTNVNDLGITHWMLLPQPPESEGE